MRIGCQGNYIRGAVHRQRGENPIVRVKSLHMKAGFKGWFTVDTLGLSFLRHGGNLVILAHVAKADRRVGSLVAVLVWVNEELRIKGVN